MAKAITQIEKKRLSAEEERAEDLAAIVKQIAENRESIQDSLVILQELHELGAIDMLKGLLRTREKVGAIAIDQMNQPGMHNIIKNAMSSIQLLAEMDSDQLKNLFNGLNQGIQMASESMETKEDIGMWGLLKSTKDPNVKRSLNTMIQFLNGMGEGLNKKETH